MIDRKRLLMHAPMSGPYEGKRETTSRGAKCITKKGEIELCMMTKENIRDTISKGENHDENNF